MQCRRSPRSANATRAPPKHMWQRTTCPKKRAMQLTMGRHALLGEVSRGCTARWAAEKSVRGGVAWRQDVSGVRGRVNAKLHPRSTGGQGVAGAWLSKRPCRADGHTGAFILVSLCLRSLLVRCWAAHRTGGVGDIAIDGNDRPTTPRGFQGWRSGCADGGGLDGGSTFELRLKSTGCSRLSGVRPGFAHASIGQATYVLEPG